MTRTEIMRAQRFVPRRLFVCAVQSSAQWRSCSSVQLAPRPSTANDDVAIGTGRCTKDQLAAPEIIDGDADALFVENACFARARRRFIAHASSSSTILPQHAEPSSVRCMTRLQAARRPLRLSRAHVKAGHLVVNPAMHDQTPTVRASKDCGLSRCMLPRTGVSGHDLPAKPFRSVRFSNQAIAGSIGAL